MNKNNEINQIGFYKRYGGTGDICNGYPRESYVQFIKQEEGWVLLVDHCFVNQLQFRPNNITRITDITFLQNGEAIMNSILDLGLENLEKSYFSDEFLAGYSGIWEIICNDKLISSGHDCVEVELVEKFKELIEFDSLMKNINLLAVEYIEDYDDKINFALWKNIYNLSDDLSYEEKRSYVEEQLNKSDDLKLMFEI